MRDYVNSTALQEYTTKLVAKLKTLFPGTPTAAATVADMTDHSKTYVYVGSETGYTAGDWYYWNGTDWTSGGPFQATSIITDTTLAVAGEAADAKATGDAIAAAKAAVLNAMAPAYSTSATYAVGDYVNYNGSIYRCTTAITTAESWTSGHWTAVVLGADLASQVSDLKTQIFDNENIDFTNIALDRWCIRKTAPQIWNEYGASEKTRGCTIPIPNNVSYITITANEHGAIIGVLSTENHNETTDKHVDWANGYSARIEIAAGETRKINTDKSTRFLFVMRHTSADLDITPNITYTKAKGDILAFTVEQGRWNGTGGKEDTNEAIRSSELLELCPGSILDVNITEPGWVYYIRQGNEKNNLITTDRLSDSDTVYVRGKYVAFAFYKIVSGSRVNVGVNDWNNQVIFRTHGNAIHYEKELFLDFIVEQGRWSGSGTKVSTNQALRANEIIEMTPGTVLSVIISEPNWVYYIRQGNQRNKLTTTHRLSDSDSVMITSRYVAFAFYKVVNDVINNVSMDDWHNQVRFASHGYAKHYESEMYHDMPENEGQMNVVGRAYQVTKLQYTPKANLPVNFNYYDGTQGNYYIAAGADVEGIVYSSVREESTYVPQAVSIHTFMTAILNPNSYLYTKTSTAPNSKTYYGAVCSSFVAYCYGIDNVIPTTYAFPTYPGFVPLENATPQNFKIGDMLNKPANPNHIVIVTDIIRNRRGKVVYVEISQETSSIRGTAITEVLTADDVYSRYLNLGYSPYRYNNIGDVPYTPSPWVHVDETEVETPVYNTNLSPRRGDCANWRPGEDIEIDVLDAEDYTSYKLYNAVTGTLISTGAIPANNLIVFANASVSVGRYKVCLTDGSNNSGFVYFDKMDENNHYYPDATNHQVRITFSSDLGNPVSVSWCDNYNDTSAKDSNKFQSVRAFDILTQEEINAGEVTLIDPAHRTPPATGKYDGKWLIHVNYQTPYGLYASDLTAVSVGE